MDTIWKFPLRLEERQVISVPSVHGILDLQIQNAVACLWMAVDSQSPTVETAILHRGTGTSLVGNEGTYLGTYQVREYVWHVFEEKV